MRENVTLIPARRRAGNRIAIAEERPKLKVAAYCRVSTDSNVQAGSYEVQVQHYTDYIKRNSLQAFTPMMVFPVPTQRSAKASWK